MNGEPHILYCIDDYGMTPLTCDRIDECLDFGAANKISVLPNTRMPDISERLASRTGAALSIHINLVEGKALSPREQVPLLVDDDGYFRKSFFGLLMTSLSGQRQQFAQQVYTEIRAQILRAQEIFPEGTPVLVDSHQHTHMVPVIFDALMCAIRDLKLDVQYIRIPAEPIGPYLAKPSLYPEYVSVNFIKHWVLKCCQLFNRKKLRESGIPTALFCGIMFSGHMNYRRVSSVLPGYLRLARKKNCGIEILFHSGYTNAGEPLFDDRKVSFHGFYYSEGRKEEYDALMKLK